MGFQKGSRKGPSGVQRGVHVLYRPLRCLFGRRLRYQFFKHLCNKTVEREESHRFYAELLAVA